MSHFQKTKVGEYKRVDPKTAFEPSPTPKIANGGTKKDPKIQGSIEKKRSYSALWIDQKTFWKLTKTTIIAP